MRMWVTSPHASYKSPRRHKADKGRRQGFLDDLSALSGAEAEPFAVRIPVVANPAKHIWAMPADTLRTMADSSSSAFADLGKQGSGMPPGMPAGLPPSGAPPEAAVDAAGLVGERLTLQAFAQLSGTLGGYPFVKVVVDRMNATVHFLNNAKYAFHADYIAERILGMKAIRN